mmetsp:Transcript_30538/g.93401  ORF Transcript_30538/g.93401 Transcript_30538/m.93401 type:complete len:103 (-) Transcript_30538:566-874(-)|eukprot:scaffold56_cov33-Tisochrysis_lutea.AAC.2
MNAVARRYFLLAIVNLFVACVLATLLAGRYFVVVDVPLCDPGLTSACGSCSLLLSLIQELLQPLPCERAVVPSWPEKRSCASQPPPWEEKPPSPFFVDAAPS